MPQLEFDVAFTMAQRVLGAIFASAGLIFVIGVGWIIGYLQGSSH